MRGLACCLVIVLAGCTREPPELEPAPETGRFPTEAALRSHFDELARTATVVKDVTNPRNQPVEFKGSLVAQNLKCLLKLTGPSGFVWIKGDVTGAGIDSRKLDGELAARFSGRIATTINAGSAVLWFEQTPDPKSQFLVKVLQRSIIIFSSATREQLLQIKLRIVGPVEFVVLECDVEPGRYQTSYVWGTETQGVSRLTVFKKKP